MYDPNYTFVNPKIPGTPGVLVRCTLPGTLSYPQAPMPRARALNLPVSRARVPRLMSHRASGGTHLSGGGRVDQVPCHNAGEHLSLDSSLTNSFEPPSSPPASRATLLLMVLFARCVVSRHISQAAVGSPTFEACRNTAGESPACASGMRHALPSPH